jgi:hypothetical protein
LARTMRCVRAVSSHPEPVLSVAASFSRDPVAEEEESESPIYDVVLPELAATDENDASTADSPFPRRTPERKPQFAERRYEFLFSELRRRRRA